ncbi:4-alpha-glucanotransferase [Sorangium cellulosum]|uniref:4-alpha-glucanotransferase n=1 Tax=Sorangium cellulosum TaxID=56 RepID=A0A4V0NCQ2_SORCE|nr:4-alpha-glucanotransferase [Sorangium cellulosum]AUX19962.1 4-alpha-glucanotransferase [Sorangium cellulosum]
MKDAGNDKGKAEPTQVRAQEDERELVRAALRLLGIRNLVLAIHDPSFPSDDAEDIGRGSPYTEGGRRFLRFARDLGFNGIQLGPQGETSADNASPYDGTIFSRSTLSIALARLTEDGPWGALLRPESLAKIVAGKPGGREGRALHGYAHRAQRAALREAFAAFVERRGRGELAPLAARLDAFKKRSAAWLERDALYAPLCAEHRSGSFHGWAGEPDLDRRLFAPGPGEVVACEERRRELLDRHRDEVELYAFCQLVAHEQHAALRTVTAELGLKLYGDLQIGYSPQDAWAHQSVFLKGYLMGAPPSRTNPEGQVWNYPVLDPAQYTGASAGALALVRARMDKMFDEFDGVRIDHPHGLVCPWVYVADAPDPLRAVQGGARLFSSPDLPDHPLLARYAIVSPAQLNRAASRYADDWVTSLSPEQIGRYSALFDVIASCAEARGRSTTDIVCEVLSTLPFPLRCVLERHGLGRFRVTQKADLDNPKDVYRSENAAPSDWIMVGTHDTPPLWRLLDAWERSGALERQAAYLATRLAPSPAEEGAVARALASDPHLLAQAKLADLFASEAANVMVFFSDLLGLKETYNAPGTISDDNWSLRVPRGYERSYPEMRARGAALDLPRALALALRARGGAESDERRNLITRLERRAGAAR